MGKDVAMTAGVLRRLLTDTQVHAFLPNVKQFSRQEATRKGGCCGRSARNTGSMAQLKVSLMGLPQSKLAQLKAFLGADTLIFSSPGAGGFSKTTV